jgi:electron transport complex protein RnfD
MQSTAQTAFHVTASPHMRSGKTVQSVMLDVVLALIPAGVMGVVFFGLRALLLIAVSVVSAVLWEALIQRVMGKRITVSDFSAAITGLLLAYNLPSTAPIWLPIVGNAFAIILVKQCFGGLGQNFMNPAMAARAFLMASWVGHMSGTAFVAPGFAADAVSMATPLETGARAFSYGNLIIGNVPGCIGETSKLALLVGGAYLLARGVIRWQTPVLMIGAVFALSWISSGSLWAGVDSALYQTLSGGLFLCAFFMATDYASSPVTRVGKVVMGLGCGVIVFVIRAFSGSFPEGCTYAVLVMNVATPLIDRLTRPRVYGEVKRNA